jgi:hypothetical protein
MDLIYTLYNNKRSVFRLKDVAMLTGEVDFDSLKQRLNYFVRAGKLQNPRKGIYCKPKYTMEELLVANKISVTPKIKTNYLG